VHTTVYRAVTGRVHVFGPCRRSYRRPFYTARRWPYRQRCTRVDVYAGCVNCRNTALYGPCKRLRIRNNVYTACARPCIRPYTPPLPPCKGHVVHGRLWAVYTKRTLNNRSVVTGNRNNIEIFLYIWRALSLYPDGDPDRHQNLIICSFSLADCQPSVKISCKSVARFCAKLLTDRQADNDENITCLAEEMNNWTSNPTEVLQSYWTVAALVLFYFTWTLSAAITSWRCYLLFVNCTGFALHIMSANTSVEPEGLRRLEIKRHYFCLITCTNCKTIKLVNSIKHFVIKTVKKHCSM